MQSVNHWTASEVLMVSLFLMNLFIFGRIGSLLLRTKQLFSSCGERGLLFVVVRGLFTAVASLVEERGL